MKRFGALRFVASLYRVLGWLVLIGGILFGIATMALSAIGSRAWGMGMSGMTSRWGLGGLLGGIVAGLFIIALALLYFVLLLSVADGIAVGLSIEENTREMATYLRGEASPAPPRPSWEEPPLDE
jgi:hypothetical protein